MLKFIVNNPYDYNTISLKKNQSREKKVQLTPTQEMVLANPLSNFIGKYLGVETGADWSRYYDKVDEITQWAKKRANSEDLNDIAKEVKEALNEAPETNNHRVLDVYLTIKLMGDKKKEKEETDKEEVKKE